MNGRLRSLAAASRPLVKICGLTNLEDARHAVASGADLLGFVLAPESPRCVTPERVAGIVRGLRDGGCSVPCVGVFAHEEPERLRRLAGVAGADVVQLHGAASADSGLPALGVPVMLTQRVCGQVRWAELAAQNAWAYLLDGYSPNALGGAGVSWDWSLLEDAVVSPEATQVRRRLFVAGGLTPENVVEVVRRLRPLGVDVSSGVERAPGRKDPARVERFIRNAKEAARAYPYPR